VGLLPRGKEEEGGGGGATSLAGFERA